jgi:type IV secretion system protein VirD4
MALVCRVTLILAFLLLAYGLVALSLQHQFVAFVVLGLIAWQRMKRRHTTNDHGSARTASLAEIEEAGLLADDANSVLLGRCLTERSSLTAAIGGLLSPDVRSATAVQNFFAVTYSQRWRSEQLIRTNRHVHIATFSPAGGGKGVAALIPNLLAYQGNVVVCDPKGELYAATAEHRRRRFGKTIRRLDPFEVCGPGGDTLNPFDFIDETSKFFLDRVRALANSVIIRPPAGDEKQPHFNDMAEIMLTGVSAFCMGCEHDRDRRNLGTVRAIASSRDIYTQAVKMMQTTDSCDGVIKRLGGILSFPAEEEMSSIFTTLARQTEFLDSPPVIRNVTSSSFDPMDLKTGNTDLYLILPHDMLVPLQRLQRLWINAVMRRVTSGPPDESRTLLWLLDEFAHIGRMQIIEDAVTLYRGYGMRLWFIFQSLGQLRTCFGDKAQAILDNIGTQQFFGINSYETAEEISKRIGTGTLGTVSVSDSVSRSHASGAKSEQANVSTSSSVTHNEIGRRLLMPEEILTLPDDITLIFHKNLPVIPARLIRFFEAPEFRNGGTAAPRRLGFAAALLAAFTLFASMLFVDSALLLAALPAALPARSQASSRPQPAGRLRSATPYRQPPRPRVRTRQRSGESGFLIKI